MGLEWHTRVQFVRGVGPRRAAILAKAGIHTVEDLLYHLPHRYEDRSRFLPLAALREGEAATVGVRVVNAAVQKTRRRGFVLFRALVEDDSGSMPCIWFNQPYLQDVLTPGRRVVLFGAPTPDRYAGRMQLENPQYELVEEGDEQIHTGRMVPVHLRVESISPKAIRSIVHGALAGLQGPLPDPLPGEISSRLGLEARLEAFRQAHFPPEGASLETWNARLSPSHRRLAFEELFLLEAGLVLRRKGMDEAVRGIAFDLPADLDGLLGRVLPFTLTAAQRRALDEILADLASERCMHRLLQGDVGSGKTVVALLAMLVVVESGYQALLMVPTEILAEQHQRSLDRFLEETPYRTRLLTASLPAAERRASMEAMESGEARIIVGTHALLQEKVGFHRLGLVVVDEQHRFGVMQRARIREKGWNPDVLVMTATPIPRSLALTVYGELDISIIDELPPGRRKIATAVRDDSARGRVYSFLREQMDAGRQVYVVYPLVEETEESDLKAATEAAARLRKRFAPHAVGLVHGRIKKEEREEVMRAFRAGEVKLLVATTVIEVGVDVPNATVMLVEHAERFGLSQLHQLRGRVGRGAQRSWCVLMRGRRATPDAERRLEAMVETSDGFRIAERDLEIRGPGEFFGTKQSGLPPLRAANIIRDRQLLELAREEALRLAEGEGFPAALKRYLHDVWGERFGLVEVG